MKAKLLDFRGAVMVVAILATVLFFGDNPALAACSGTRCHEPGTLELAADGWLGGASGGVPVYSNGTLATNDNGESYVTIASRRIFAGTKWQCVELVNRLYLSKGWITSTWFGNGDTLKDHIPKGLTWEANGSITYLNPGDVVTMGGAGGGHAAIVNWVVDGKIQLINQNTSSVDTYATMCSG